MNCVKCGSPIQPGQKFCVRCGTPVNQQAMPQQNQPLVCNNCGAILKPGQKFCVKCGKPAGAPASQDQIKKGVHDMASTINSLAGEGGDVDIHLGVLFSEVFKHHTKQEQEELFICGTEKTTPKAADMMDEWPKPWLYMRVLALLLITFICLYVICTGFQNTNGVPGALFVGAMAVPFALIIFFWEINVPRNISIFEVCKLFFLGGAISLVSTLILYMFVTINQLDYVGAILVGILEEAGKGLIVYYFLREKNYRYILNGLLIGACIGAGFAVFETAGYAFNYLYYGLQYSYADGIDLMLEILLLRGILSIGGHVVWSAMIGGGIVINKTKNNALIPFAIIAIALHAIWDMPITFGSEIYLVQILLTIAAWFVILTLIASGLKQVKRISDHFKKLEQQNKH